MFRAVIERCSTSFDENLSERLSRECERDLSAENVIRLLAAASEVAETCSLFWERINN